MAGTFEVDQATGALARIVIANETDWGVVNTSPQWKAWNLPPGESLDANWAVYNSNIIRPDRMSNFDIVGTQKPGGSLPFELSPTGQNEFFRSLLGYVVSTSGSGPYTHIIRGWGDTLSRNAGPFPAGISVEKQFQDLGTPTYFSLLGSKVNSCSLNFNVDALVTGSFDILSREVVKSTTSVTGVNTIADLTSDPYQSVQVSVYEGSSLQLLGTATQLTLTINNNMRGANVLGSNKYANIKPGTRMVTGTGTFLFNTTALYDKAISQTGTKLQFTVSNGIYTHDFLMPNCRFTPNASMPKITDGGPLSIPLSFKAARDATTQTDLQLTITTSQASIAA